jgi:outer membrane protein TolC
MKQMLLASLFGIASISLPAQAQVQAQAQTAEFVSFDQIEEIVRTKNPMVNSMKEKAEAKKSREGHLVRSFLPEVAAEVSHENFKTGLDTEKSQPAWRVEATLNVFRGGADRLEEKARSLETNAADFEAKVSAKDQLQKAYGLYWLLAYKQDVLQTLNSHLEISKKNLSEANRRISSGVATSTDRLEFEMKMSLIKQEVALTEKDIRLLSLELGNILGFTAAVLPKNTDNHFHDWETSLKPLKADDLPEVKMTVTERDALNARRDQYRADYFPAVDLYAGEAQDNQRAERDHPDEADRRESYMGIRASWSLGKTISSRVERSSLQKEVSAKETQLVFLRRQAEISQSSKFDELKTLHSFVHDSEENIKASSRYLEATRKEYGRGVKNSPDVLEATEKYISAKLRFAEITRDFNLLYSSQLALKEL